MNRPFSDDIGLQSVGHAVTLGAKKPIVPLAAGSLFAAVRLQNSSCTKGYPDVAAEVVAVVPEYPPFFAPRVPPSGELAVTCFDGHEKPGEETVCVCVRSSRSPRTAFFVSPTDIVPSSVRISLPCALLTTLHPLGHDEPRKNVANPAGVASAMMASCRVATSSCSASSHIRISLRNAGLNLRFFLVEWERMYGALRL